MSLIDMLKRRVEPSDTIQSMNSNKGDNSASKIEDENSPFTDLRNYPLTWKERYEIALRYGVLIQIEGEKPEDKLPEFVKTVKISKEEKNLFLAKLPENQKGQLMSHSDVAKFINIEDKLIKSGISAGTILDGYLKELTIITLYLQELIPTSNKDKAKIIEEVNRQILSVIGNAAKTLNSQYIIQFINILYNKFADKIKYDEYRQLIGMIASSDNNTMLLELIQQIIQNFEFKEYSEIIKIVEALQEKIIFSPEHEFSPESYSKDKRTQDRYEKLKEKNELRNIDLSMVKDIIDSIDFKGKQPKDIINVINKISELNSEKLNEFWLRYSNEKASYEIILQRLNKHSNNQNNKRKIRKPKLWDKKCIYRMCIAGGIAAGMAVAFFAGRSYEKNRFKNISTPTTYFSRHIEKPEEMTSLEIELPDDLTIGNGAGYLKKGTKVYVIGMEDQNEIVIETPDIEIKNDQLGNNEFLAQYIQKIEKDTDTMIKDKISALDEKEYTPDEYAKDGRN